MDRCEYVFLPLAFCYTSVPDSELLTTLFRTYNAGAEFCQAYPHPVKGIAMLNIDDVQEGYRAGALREDGLAEP